MRMGKVCQVKYTSIEGFYCREIVLLHSSSAHEINGGENLGSGQAEVVGDEAAGIGEWGRKPIRLA